MVLWVPELLHEVKDDAVMADDVDFGFDDDVAGASFDDEVIIVDLTFDNDVAAIGLTFDDDVAAIGLTFDDDVIAVAFTFDDDVITEALTLEAGTPFFFAGIGAADFTE